MKLFKLTLLLLVLITIGACEKDREYLCKCTDDITNEIVSISVNTTTKSLAESDCNISDAAEGISCVLD